MTEWSAGDYHQQSSLQKTMAETQLRKLTLLGDEQVLDIGCGDGKVTAEIARRVPRGSVVGVDPSQNMVDFAAKHFGPPTHPNLRFQVIDARRLTFHNEFDLVVSFNALHWVPEQKDALTGIRNALRPSGRTQLRFVSEGPRPSLEDIIEETRKDRQWAQYFEGYRKPYAHFTPDEYKALAESAGLRVVHIDVEDGSWDFETRDGFESFANATFVEWTQHIPRDEWHDFITDVLDRYQTIAADHPTEQHTFKFYQMNVALEKP